MHSVLIECVVKGDVRADQGNVCTVYARLGGSVFDVLSQSVPCITTHVQFSSLFCDWSKHPSNNAAVAWLIAATVLVHVGVCFIQRNINNEPFWTRLYRGGDKMLVGLKTDSPRRAYGTWYLLNVNKGMTVFNQHAAMSLIALSIAWLAGRHDPNKGERQ